MKRMINRNINKSLKIIDREKEKIKEEKKKIELEKQKKFYKTSLGKFLMDLFDVNDNEVNITAVIKRRAFCNFLNILFGIFLCLTVLFILSGGKNYLKLYKELYEFVDVYDTISSEYYGKFDKNELIQTAIDSVINEVGDVYTTYSNASDTQNFFENLEGTYEGIGCMVSMDENENIYVVDVFEGTPADEAKLLVGDIILEIDGIDYTNKTSDEMATYVKEKAKDEIMLKVKRGEQQIGLTIVRDTVEISNVSGELIEKDGRKIGYIDIAVFAATSSVQFKNELKKLEKDGIEGLIIDVRENTGGYLSVVTDISSLFLEKGKVIYQLETGKKIEKIKDKTRESRSYPIVVLTNGGSASASEILAATIKESYNGYVVGTNTYGKGTVQKTKTLSDGSMIKYTVQNWLTPNGNYIDENGISPTDVVDFKESGYKGDSQLDYAINLIKNNLK